MVIHILCYDIGNESDYIPTHLLNDDTINAYDSHNQCV